MSMDVHIHCPSGRLELERNWALSYPYRNDTALSFSIDGRKNFCGVGSVRSWNLSPSLGKPIVIVL